MTRKMGPSEVIVMPLTESGHMWTPPRLPKFIPEAIPEDEVLALLGITRQMLEQLHLNGAGPFRVGHGAGWVYPVNELRQWMASRGLEAA